MTTLPILADRDEFLRERLTCLGGSDAASLFSAGYGCLRRLFYSKRNTPADAGDDDSPILRRGRKLERVALEEFALASGRRLESVGLICHPDYPEIGAHQDAVEYDDTRPERGPGTIEVKCLGRESFFRTKREGMIDDYQLQIQHGMLAAGTQWGTFVVFWPDGFQLLWWDVERDEDLCRMIQDAAVATWRQIQDPDSLLPERLDPHDKRCATCRWQRSCQGARLLEIMEAGKADENDLEFDGTIAALAAEYHELRRIAADAGDMADEAANALKAALGDRQAAETHGFRIYYRVSERASVDTKALKKDLPDVAAKYTKTTATRALRIYPARSRED